MLLKNIYVRFTLPLPKSAKRSLLFVPIALLVLMMFRVTLPQDEVSISHFKSPDRSKANFVDRDIRILFLTHRYDYTYFMDRSFQFQYEAAKRHPFVEAVLWGIGMPEYNNSVSLKENLVQKYKSIYFDVIIIHGRFPGDQVIAISNETVIAFREHECFDGRCSSIIQRYNVSVFLFAYMIDMRFYTSNVRMVLQHSPHSAEPNIFFRKSSSLRNCEVLLLGAINEVYPIREKWKRFIEEGAIKGKHYRHVGYYEKSFDSFNSSIPWSEEDQLQVSKRKGQVENYANEMKNSKICLMDSSVYRYALMKYVEATMAGCLIIGDIPFDHYDLFSQFVVPVSNSMSEQELINVVNYYRSHEKERLLRVRLGQKLIKKFTWDHTVDTLIRAVNNYKRNVFGSFYGGAFMNSCAAKNAMKKTLNEWC